MLERVIVACKKAALYVNMRPRKDFHIKARVAVVTPTGDAIIPSFSSRCDIYQGSEHDVLDRYARAVADSGADYLVRITGDCPLIPPTVISKMLLVAVNNRYDYVSNVDEKFRTSVDGTDCEIISKKLLEHAAAFATAAGDREHVTTMIRREPPEWAKIGFVIDPFDNSCVKLSVDTEDDLKAVRHAFESGHEKYVAACETFGHRSVHRL